MQSVKRVTFLAPGVISMNKKNTQAYKDCILPNNSDSLAFRHEITINSDLTDL